MNKSQKNDIDNFAPVLAENTRVNDFKKQKHGLQKAMLKLEQKTPF